MSLFAVVIKEKSVFNSLYVYEGFKKGELEEEGWLAKVGFDGGNWILHLFLRDFFIAEARFSVHEKK